MSCQICGRYACMYSFHSLEEQFEFDEDRRMEKEPKTSTDEPSGDDDAEEGV